jgi:molybdopterin synthase catalytic subunit
MGASEVCLPTAPFDPATQIAAFTRAHPASGGIVSFIGQVRADDPTDAGAVEALELQHYAPLTLPAMQVLADAALARWAIDGLLIVHRSGVMGPGEPIVLVAAAARHRRDAFAAADYVMDHLKSESWFWKREKRAGVWRWVEPRAQDAADLTRWGQP